jgi:hypothetical protein
LGPPETDADGPIEAGRSAIDSAMTHRERLPRAPPGPRRVAVSMQKKRLARQDHHGRTVGTTLSSRFAILMALQGPGPSRSRFDSARSRARRPTGSADCAGRARRS